MKLKSFALSLMVASSQLLLGVYQTQLKAGECYLTVTKYPLDAFCKDNCTDGSGSCFSSYQKSIVIMSKLRVACIINRADLSTVSPGKKRLLEQNGNAVQKSIQRALYCVSLLLQEPV